MQTKILFLFYLNKHPKLKIAIVKKTLSNSG